MAASAGDGAIDLNDAYAAFALFLRCMDDGDNYIMLMTYNYAGRYFDAPNFYVAVPSHGRRLMIIFHTSNYIACCWLLLRFMPSYYRELRRSYGDWYRLLFSFLAWIMVIPSGLMGDYDFDNDLHSQSRDRAPDLSLIFFSCWHLPISLPHCRWALMFATLPTLFSAIFAIDQQ